MPGTPSTRATAPWRARRPKTVVSRATVSAPRATAERPRGNAAGSARRTTSGASTASSPARSPSRAAARKASTTRRCPASGSGGSAAVPRTRCRARLASFLAATGVRPTIGAIRSKGTAKPSCSTKATRSAGPSRSSTTSSARPTDSTSNASRSGSAPPPAATGSASPVGSSRRAARARSRSRQIRETTVVSQPGRLSISAGSVRTSRSQASCTASSASPVDPSIRWAIARSRPRSASKRAAVPSAVDVSAAAPSATAAAPAVAPGIPFPPIGPLGPIGHLSPARLVTAMTIRPPPR